MTENKLNYEKIAGDLKMQLGQKKRIISAISETEGKIDQLRKDSAYYQKLLQENNDRIEELNAKLFEAVEVFIA